MGKRKISTIRFFAEKVSVAPQNGDNTGFHKAGPQWFRDRVEINGTEPDAPAVDIKVFEKMLLQPGFFEPFTCTCGNAGCANIDSFVRCLHKDDLIIMVIRDPLRSPEWTLEEEFEHSCQQRQKFRYKAHLFRRSDISRGLEELKRFYGRAF